MKYKKLIIWFGAILVVCIAVVLFTQPILIKAIYAKYKSTDHFLTFEGDARIRYEPTAKQHAITLSEILDDSQKVVEDTLGAQIQKPIGVYICSTQEVFNEYVFLSKNVRGAVYWGKLFLSPGAFNRGSLSDLIEHELTHYLFYTHLGERAHIEGIPLWFREGIAVFVANGGASYTEGRNIRSVMSRRERESFLSGDIDFWFTSTDPRDAVSNGVANWLLYRVGALFVHFMHDSNPQQFGRLIQTLLEGEPFEQAVYSIYERDINVLLSEFSEHL